MGRRAGDGEEILPDYESSLDPIDPLGLGPPTPSLASRHSGSTDSSADKAAVAAGLAEGPVAGEDGMLELNPLDEPMTDSSFPDDAPRPDRMDRWGRRERRGLRFQRWIEHAATPGDPCPILPCALGPEDVGPFVTDLPDMTLPPDISQDALRMGLIANTDILAKFASVSQPVDAASGAQQLNNWQVYVAEGILCISFMFRYRGRRGFHTSDVMKVACEYFYPMESLKSVYYSKVANPSDIRFVARIYDEFNLFPTDDEPERDTHFTPQEWKHGSSEYRALLGTYTGRVVAYLILGAYPRRTHRISRVVTWYTWDDHDKIALLQMRFDIEPIPVPTPPLEGMYLDPLGVPEYAKRKERMTSRGRPQKAKAPAPGPGPVAGPPAKPFLPPVFGTPKAGSVTHRIKCPEVKRPKIPEEPRPLFEGGKRPAFLAPGTGPKDERPKMIPEEPRPRPGGAKPAKGFDPMSFDEPLGFDEPIPTPIAREKGARGPAPAPAPGSEALPLRKTKDVPKPKSGKRSKRAPAEPAAELPAKRAKKAKKETIPEEPKDVPKRKRVRGGEPRQKRVRGEGGRFVTKSPSSKQTEKAEASPEELQEVSKEPAAEKPAADPADPPLKKCSRCLKRLPPDHFQPRNDKGPITKTCKKCRNAKRATAQPRMKTRKQIAAEKAAAE
ncbi:uncharacterized protein N7484_000654 [Penicillium longicatenatum]|uniref:uncharacterized protein n=1 Tax=Penicillium longicatenatum TaxID=1561947 RepID=UPI002547B567|nr:uncharacterized protein N7484_000654 [Penicillium longicatenatum]KAJ5661282.1 hypothetical protein N7484_000654 [Penicillium longicatenatum]